MSHGTQAVSSASKGWWRIYYGDGSVFTDADGSPSDAPRENVQIIVTQDDAVGYRICTTLDFFIFDPGRGGWRETNQWGMYDHLVHCPQPLVLMGRFMPNDQWIALLRKVKTELGPKQGWLMNEVKRDGC